MGDQISKESDVAQVTKSREDLKAANDALEAELLRKERLRAESIRGGQSEMTVAPVKKEETAKEYAARVMSGGLNGEKKDEVKKEGL